MPVPVPMRLSPCPGLAAQVNGMLYIFCQKLPSACRYESIIATLCENLDTLDEPEAKASMIWIIGEYAERIDNADELLEQFLETFPEETTLVSQSQRQRTVHLRDARGRMLCMSWPVQRCLIQLTSCRGKLR